MTQENLGKRPSEADLKALASCCGVKSPAEVKQELMKELIAQHLQEPKEKSNNEEKNVPRR